jgi:hypothetical protein
MIRGGTVKEPNLRSGEERTEVATMSISPSTRLDCSDGIIDGDTNDDFVVSEEYYVDDDDEYEEEIIEDQSIYEEETIVDGLSTIWEETSKDMTTVVGASDIRSVATFDTTSVSSHSRSSWSGGRKRRSGKRPSKNDPRTGASNNKSVTSASLDSFFERDKRNNMKPVPLPAPPTTEMSSTSVSLNSFFSGQHEQHQRNSSHPSMASQKATMEPSCQNIEQSEDSTAAQMIALMSFLTGEQVWIPAANDHKVVHGLACLSPTQTCDNQSDDEYTFVSCTTEGTETLSLISAGGGRCATDAHDSRPKPPIATIDVAADEWDSTLSPDRIDDRLGNRMIQEIVDGMGKMATFSTTSLSSSPASPAHDAQTG